MSNDTKNYLFTGANAGIGLAATLQLADLPSSTHVYMLCRDTGKARRARGKLGNVHCVAFDCYRPNDIDLSQLPSTIHGILLNAGGLGDDSSASLLAPLNLLGHVRLVESLMQQGQLAPDCRIIAAGSEAVFTIPDWRDTDWMGHLRGTAGDWTNRYAYSKGMVALYWSAFARRHPNYFVATISPGAVHGTHFYQSAPAMVKIAARVLTWMHGSHAADEGAARYLDGLLWGRRVEITSGSFWAHRKGYVRDFGDVVSKRAVFGDVALQDQVWDAVNEFMKEEN